MASKISTTGVNADISKENKNQQPTRNAIGPSSARFQHLAYPIMPGCRAQIPCSGTIRKKGILIVLTNTHAASRGVRVLKTNVIRERMNIGTSTFSSSG